MSHRPAGLYGSDICFIYVAYKSTYMNPWLICVLYILAYNIYVGIYVIQSRLCQHMWHFICLIYVCSVWVSPAYATIPSLVRYTNRPSRHQRRYRKSLTVVLTTPLLTQGDRRGVVVSGVRRMNEVSARRARLVPGWVTVFERVYHLGM